MSTFWYYFDNTICTLVVVVCLGLLALEGMAALNSDR